MAKYQYRARVESTEPSANGSVNCDTYVERLQSKNPDVWQLIENGHRTISLGAIEITNVTESSLNATQKKKSLEDLVWAKVVAMGLTSADDACLQLEAILVAPFVITGTL